MTLEYYCQYVFPLVIAFKVTITSHVEKDLSSGHVLQRIPSTLQTCKWRKVKCRMCWITPGDGFPLFNKVGDESQSSKEQSRLPVSHLARRRLVNAEDTTLKSGMKVGSSTAELGFTRSTIYGLYLGYYIQKQGSK